jgi:hypothetical protein
MDRDNITRTGARTPGAEDYSTSTAAHAAGIDLTQSRNIDLGLSHALKAMTNRIATDVCREQA